MSAETGKSEIIWTTTEMPLGNLAAVMLCVQKRNRNEFTVEENEFLDAWNNSIRISENKDK